MVALSSPTFFEKSHSRARGIASACTDSSRRKSLDRIDMRFSIYESRVGLESFSRDPIEYEGSKWNLYEFLSGHALVRIDPMGLESFVHPDDINTEDGCQTWRNQRKADCLLRLRNRIGPISQELLDCYAAVNKAANKMSRTCFRRCVRDSRPGNVLQQPVFGCREKCLPS